MDANEPTMTLHRELAAPIDRVWSALTRPEHLTRWWGPSGFRTETHVHELRPGGVWRLTMHGPDGHAYLNHAVFDVVEPPHRLDLRYVDAPGAEPARHTTTLRLEALGPAHTRITLIARFPTLADRDEVVTRYGADHGARQTLARLAELVEGAPAAARGMELRRVLAAPVETVWAVWTDAAHLHAWFHPRSWSIFTADLDLRVGGTFFYGFRGPELPDTYGLWRFTEVDPPRRLAFELSFADADRRILPSPFGGPWPARTATTITLEPHAGIGAGTVLTMRSVPVEPTEAELAAFLDAIPDMEGGWGETFDSLAAHIS